MELAPIFPLQAAWFNGQLKRMEALVDTCMTDYDENGWKHPAYKNGGGIRIAGKS